MSFEAIIFFTAFARQPLAPPMSAAAVLSILPQVFRARKQPAHRRTPAVPPPRLTPTPRAPLAFCPPVAIIQKQKAIIIVHIDSANVPAIDAFGAPCRFRFRQMSFADTRRKDKRPFHYLLVLEIPREATASTSRWLDIEAVQPLSSLRANSLIPGEFAVRHTVLCWRQRQVLFSRRHRSNVLRQQRRERRERKARLRKE